jgi:hypothetical protein
MNDAWPDDARAAALLNFARSGGTVILFVRPGLEASWAKLSAGHRAALEAILPSAPLAMESATANGVSIAAAGDPLIAGFQPDALKDVFVRRLIPFSSDPQGTTILSAQPKDAPAGARPAGLLYRRAVGPGTVYTLATLPEKEFTNLQFHPLFLPMLVRMAQRPPARSEARNIEIGQPVVLSGPQFDSFSSLTLAGPHNELTVIKPTRTLTGIEFSFGPAIAPGLYTWFKPQSGEALAMTNVQLPAGESELVYTSAAATTETGEQLLIARSVAELQSTLAHRGEPRPQWALPIALVLVLLCMEAAMASIARTGKQGIARAVPSGTPR